GLLRKASRGRAIPVGGDRGSLRGVATYLAAAVRRGARLAPDRGARASPNRPRLRSDTRSFAASRRYRARVRFHLPSALLDRIQINDGSFAREIPPKTHGLTISSPGAVSGNLRCVGVSFSTEASRACATTCAALTFCAVRPIAK